MRSQVARLRAEAGELIAKHERSRDLSEFGKYADDPLGFMRDVLHCEPWAKQTEMVELVRDNRRTVVVTANGLGKDWATGRLALWWTYARQGRVILTGPTERQVKHILMREVRRAFSGAPDLPGELYTMELRLGDDADAGILAFASNSVDRLSGFHHPRLLICITEGQGVADEAYEAAFACTTGEENRLFVYGNPTRPTGQFHRVAHADNWAHLRIAATEHPNVVRGEEIIPGAVSRAWVESMRQEYGETSSIYRSRVLALFPEDALEGLIRRQWLDAAVARWEAGELESRAWRSPHRLALDIARYGPDASVLAHVQGPIVRELVTWRGASVTESVDKVRRYGAQVAELTLHNRWEKRHAGRPPTVTVDEPGLGGGAIDLLKKERYPTRAFNGASRAQDPRRFLNLRAQAFWAFRTLLEQDKIALPPDTLLEEEALAVEWQLTPTGLIQIVGKDLIRRELGRSPDRLDAVVMGLNASMGPTPPQVRILQLRI